MSDVRSILWGHGHARDQRVPTAEVADSMQQSPSGTPVMPRPFLPGRVTMGARAFFNQKAGDSCGVAGEIANDCGVQERSRREAWGQWSGRGPPGPATGLVGLL